MLIGRKVGFLTVATFARDNPMFQTSLALAIISVAYGLQRWLNPFISAAEQHALVVAHAAYAYGPVQGGGPQPPPPAPTAGVEAHGAAAGGGARRRASVAAAGAAALATMEHITEFNLLELVLLMTCFGVLLGGAIFKSAVFEQGNFFHWCLTVVVFTVQHAARHDGHVRVDDGGGGAPRVRRRGAAGCGDGEAEVAPRAARARPRRVVPGAPLERGRESARRDRARRQQRTGVQAAAVHKPAR